jgi:hypothetical protein
MTTDLWAGVARQWEQPPAPGAARPGIQQRRRRGFDPRREDGRAAVRLVRDDGLLRWVYEPPAHALGDSGRRAWRAFGTEPGDIVQRIAFPELGSNEVTSALQAVDTRLNGVLTPLVLREPVRGLRRWQGAGWTSVPPGFLEGLRGRVLVLVHGTFSASAMYAKELQVTPEGRTLLEGWTAAGGPYAAVLAFDHPTLSVAPWLNALALRDALAPCQAGFDFLAHSRGGLVVSWLLRMAPQLPVDKALFVGSPLAGTSLAAPDKLRKALDTLASVADALAEAAKQTGQLLPGLQPLAMGVGGLAWALGKVLHLGAKLPVADIAVGLVPGLLAQGRVDNNLELTQLYPLVNPARVHAIGCQFVPDEVNEPLWKLWTRMGHIKDQAMYYGADLVFDQPNDLVVDCASMNWMGRTELLAPEWTHLGPRADTHHCSYFQNVDVLAWMDRHLG